MRADVTAAAGAQTCSELKLHNNELKEEVAVARSHSQKSMTQMEEHQQRELRTLVASAQQDLDAARLANARAERDRLRAVEQVRGPYPLLSDQRNPFPCLTWCSVLDVRWSLGRRACSHACGVLARPVAAPTECLAMHVAAGCPVTEPLHYPPHVAGRVV